MSTPSSHRLGPYTLGPLLGQGGMGAVYLARHDEGYERAVKVLTNRDWNPTRLARFEREVRNLARVRDPGVVAVHEAGVERGRPWFAMERIEGPSLEALMQSRLPLERALDLAEGVARGAAALHAVGILHRDLKPDNVIVAAGDRPVILDLGLAIAPDQDERLTQSHAMLGTLHYMAPEQFEGRAGIGPPTDVYALGLILFELVTGTPAVPRRSSVHELIGEILHTRRPRPTALDPTLPAACDRVVARATARDATARFPNAAALAEAIEAIPHRASRSSFHGRVARWVDLSPWGRLGLRGRLATAGALALGLGVGLEVHRTQPVTSEEPATEAPTLDPRWVERGDAAWEALRSAPLETARPRAEAWRERYAGHPRADEVDAFLQTTRGQVPLARLRHAAFVGPGQPIGVTVCGERALTWGIDGRLRVWDLEAPSGPVETWEVGFAVRAVAPSPDGGGCVVGGEAERLVEVRWDGSQRTIPQPWWVYDLAFTPGGETLIVAGKFEYARVLDWPTGSERRTLGTHLAWIRGVAILDEGRQVACIAVVEEDLGRALGNAVRIWDIESGAQTAIVPLTSAPNAVVSLGRQAVVALGDGALVWIDPEAGIVHEGSPTDRGDLRGWLPLALCAEGRAVLAAGSGGREGVWGWWEDGVLGEYRTGRAPWVSVALRKDEVWIGTSEGTAEVFERVDD